MTGVVRIVVLALSLSGCHLITPFDRPVEGAPAPDGSSPEGSERCDDGVDNDGNGATDCADPACQVEYECVPMPASGSSLVYKGDGGAASCPAGGAVITRYDAGAPTCDLSGCGCGGAAGSCSVDAKLLGTACAGGPSTKLTLVPGSCSSTFGTPKGGTFSAIGGSVTCTPSGTALTTAPATPTALSTCALTKRGGGCPASQVCVRRPAAPFLAVCSMQAGAQSCPAELPTRQLVGSALNDQRSCQCACNGAAGCASAQVTVYEGGACSGSSQTVVADGLCKPFSVAPAWVRMTLGGAMMCAPSAGYAGSVLRTDEATLCCP